MKNKHLSHLNVCDFLDKRHQHHKYIKFFFLNGIPTTNILFYIFAIVYSSEGKRNIVFQTFKQVRLL